MFLLVNNPPFLWLLLFLIGPSLPFLNFKAFVCFNSNPPLAYTQHLAVISGCFAQVGLLLENSFCQEEFLAMQHILYHHSSHPAHISHLWNHKQLGRSKSSHVPALVSASFSHLAVPTSRKIVQVTFLCLFLHIDLSLLCTELGAAPIHFSGTLSKEIPCVCQA